MDPTRDADGAQEWHTRPPESWNGPDTQDGRQPSASPAAEHPHDPGAIPGTPLGHETAVTPSPRARYRTGPAVGTVIIALPLLVLAALTLWSRASGRPTSFEVAGPIVLIGCGVLIALTGAIAAIGRRKTGAIRATGRP